MGSSMGQHADYDRLRDAIGKLDTASFRGTLYRVSDPTYANTRDLLTGEGSRKYGGRWNAPGSLSVVYLAQSIEGAIAETLGMASHYGFNPAARLPLTLVAVEAILGAVLDLTDAQVRKALGTTLSAMGKCDWRGENAAGREAMTQALGRAAFANGLHGIIVPSATKRTFINVNVFPSHLGGSEKLSILRADRLPPPPPAGVL